MPHACTPQLERQFELDDVLCFVTIRPADNYVQHSFVKRRNITDEYFDVLAEENADQNIYVAQNSFQESCIDTQTGRTKCNVKDVRAVYAEVDENGDDVLKAILADSRLPKPHLVLESSPRKFQFIWYVAGFTVVDAESLNKAIAAEFGCDPAATDAARILRLAGYANVKYAERPVVRIVQEHNGGRYRRSDFKIMSVTPAEKPAYTVPAKLFAGVNRNKGMLSYMSSLRAKGLSKAQYLAAAKEANREVCDLPLDDSELIAIADSCERYRSSDSKLGVKAKIGNGGTAGNSPTIAVMDVAEDKAIQALQTEIAIPPFPEHVIRGFYKDVVDAACAGTTLPKQFVYQITKTVLGIIGSGRLQFVEQDLLPHFYLMLIAETGTGKGECYRRVREILLEDLHRKAVQVLDSADSGAGLKDAFFPQGIIPLPHNVLLFIDELLDLAYKTRPDRQPEILSTMLTLANDTHLSRTKAISRDRKMATQSCSDARLSVIECVQPKLVAACFMGVKGGSLGWYDRHYPEYADRPVAGDLPPMDSATVQSLREQRELIPFDEPMRMSREAKDLLAAFWTSLSDDKQRETRARTRILQDAYFQALGQFRSEVTAGDMQDALDIHQRQQVIRQRFYSEEISDRTSDYIAKLKQVKDKMFDRLQSGVPIEEVAITVKGLRDATNAYRSNETHIFDKAWYSFREYFQAVGKTRKRQDLLIPVEWDVPAKTN